MAKRAKRGVRLLQDPNHPLHFGVILNEQAQQDKWALLVKMDIKPSKYPDDSCLEELELKEDVWKLCERIGVAGIFRGQWPSYKRMMVEFLSSLVITKAHDAVIEKIEFQLDNKDFSFTVEELNAIFGCAGGHFWEHEDYSRNAFWRLITYFNGGEVAGVSFDPRKAKAALIRNPVFRFIQKAGAHSAFARHETGTLQAAELFMIWCGVRGESMDIGSYVVEHLGRASNKKKGILTCGGVITAIALHCEVDFSEWEMVPGGMTLGMQELMKAEFIKIDNRGRGFFLQKDGTHFPMPKKNLTTVDGWTDRANWKMISEIHKSTIEASLPVLPFRSTVVAIQVERPGMEGHVGETSQTPDDMEEFSEPSQSRRRRRPLSQLDRLELLEHRMTSMEDRMTSMEGALQGIQGEVAQFNANLSSVNENVTLMLQLMQQWGVRFPLPPQ